MQQPQFMATQIAGTYATSRLCEFFFFAKTQKLPGTFDGACNVEVVNLFHKSLIPCEHRTKHKFWRGRPKLK
jgi:hypothetical protein